jgi:Ribbon-helix-helix protein, copG family
MESGFICKKDEYMNAVMVPSNSLVTSLASNMADVATNIPTKASKPTTERLSVNLPIEMMERLRVVAEVEGLSVTELIRRGVSADQFLREQITNGTEILLREKGKKEITKVVVFR